MGAPMADDHDGTLSFLSPEQHWTVAGYFEDQNGSRTEGWALFRDRQIVAIFHNDELDVANRCADALNAGGGTDG